MLTIKFHIKEHITDFNDVIDLFLLIIFLVILRVICLFLFLLIISISWRLLIFWCNLGICILSIIVFFSFIVIVLTLFDVIIIILFSILRRYGLPTIAFL